MVLVDGVPVLYVERGGRSLLSFTEEPGVTGLPAASALAAAVRGRAGSARSPWSEPTVLARWASHLADVLTEAGFRATPKGLRLRA